jgi:hypothetical protein
MAKYQITVDRLESQPVDPRWSFTFRSITTMGLRFFQALDGWLLH